MPRAFWTDQPIAAAEEDRFNFHDYAEALSQIVLTGSTPITVGIFGPWGSGKTSLMRLIAYHLRGQRDPEARRPHVMWFNAWQYERDERPVWRSLLLRALNELRTLDLSPEDVAQVAQWETLLCAQTPGERLGALEIERPTPAGGESQPGKSVLQVNLPLFPEAAPLFDFLNAAGDEAEKLESLLDAVRRKEVNAYRQQMRLLEAFPSGFARLVNEYIWNRNGLLTIFIDDLDGCVPTRALQVLETVKLFLNVPGCAFFLAADHDQLEEVISLRYGEQEIGAGESYLEKLVQLPFSLPPLAEAQMESFITDTAPYLPTDVRRIFAYGLPQNPRMVKRMLNIYRLLHELAEQRISQGKMVDIDPTLLAKMVVIQGRYRELYRNMLEYPNLIQELDLRARGMTPETEGVAIPGLETLSSLVETYTSVRPLMRILRIGTPFANLTPLEIGGYLHLTLSTGRDQTLTLEPNQRLWDDLLSRDLTRIHPAVNAVRQQKLQQQYVTALAKLLRRDRVTPIEQRLSAAWAMGYLEEDPRDFDARVTIPAGEFPYGKESLPYYLMAYQIAKYPVTNAQYARFLQAHPEIPVPYVDADWARIYNWDAEQRTYPRGKGNYPVVLVTWDEAAAYCTWSGGRLPSQEEWERAARGLDGRAYPWGSDFDTTYANTRESGIGSTTPVGVFVDGASAAGLLDMAGNVWEWTSSDYNLQTKVIRGGAWNFPAESAQTFTVERSRTDNRSNAIGFRVAFHAAAPSG